MRYSLLTEKISTTYKSWLPLGIILLITVLFFSLNLEQIFTLQTLKSQHIALIDWQSKNFILATLLFCFVYILIVACSIPSASFLTIVAGFLFGPFFGTFLVVASATIGAYLIYFAVSLSLNLWQKKETPWLNKLRAGFKKNAFCYLLTLRLVPIFPFWMVNIAPALLNISSKTFIFATFIGIIPGTAVYASLGCGLKNILNKTEELDFMLLVEPQILFPLTLLALLAMSPVLYKKISQYVRKHF